MQISLQPTWGEVLSMRRFSFTLTLRFFVRLKRTLSLAIFAALVFSTLPAHADESGYTRYEEPGAPEQPYEIAQALDGFGALLLAPAEPFLLPVSHARDCSQQGYNGLESAGCAFIGLLISPAYVIRDVCAGAGDVLTFGYFRLSRNSGVFAPLQ